MSVPYYTKHTPHNKYIETDPSLSELMNSRRISKEVIAIFDIQSNEDGWGYPVPGGGYRWKNSDSNGHPKYKWHGKKPDTTSFYFGPNLRKEIKDSEGEVWFVSGEPDVWAMHSAGIKNVFSGFSESHLPDDLISFLYELKVKKAYIAPDRDSTGSRWASKVKDKLVDTPIELIALDLPTSLGKGGDIGKAWSGYDIDLYFEDWLKSLPVKHISRPAEEKLSPHISSESTPTVSEEYRQMIISRLGVNGFKIDGNARRNIACPFHEDENPSATLHKDIGIYCHACGETFLWNEIAGKIGLPTHAEFINKNQAIPSIRLSDQASRKLVQKKFCTVARIYEVFYIAGMDVGDTFTIKSASKLLANYGLSKNSLDEVTNNNNPKTSRFFPTNKDLKEKGEKSEKINYRARIFHLISNKQIAQRLGMTYLTRHLFDYEIPATYLSSNRKYRIAMYRSFIEKHPGEHTRDFLANQVGVTARTLRNYDKAARINVEPNCKRERLTPNTIDKLTDDRSDQPWNTWIEADGRKFSPTKSGVQRAQKFHQDVYLVTQLANTYSVIE